MYISFVYTFVKLLDMTNTSLGAYHFRLLIVEELLGLELALGSVENHLSLGSSVQ
jgi:hypothetical protein